MEKKIKVEKIMKRQRFYIFFIRPIFFVISRVFKHFRNIDKYKINKDEPSVIIANHQTDGDFLHIMSSFNVPISAVATDTIFGGRFAGNFLANSLGVIPKKKGMDDIRCAYMIEQRLKNNGTILVHLEGNRTYAEFQYYIGPSIIKLIRRNKATIILYRFEGGTGVSPRFSNKPRKGKFVGRIPKVLKYEDYKDMDDDVLFNIIKENIKQFDSESKELYKSSRRGEYLERMFFICPKCHKMHTLYSKKDKIICKECGLEVAFNEDLSIGSSDIPFTKLLDWWNFQKRFLKDYEFDDIVFKDKDIVLYKAEPFEKRKVLYKGELVLTTKELKFGDIIQKLEDLKISTVVSGTKLSYQIGDNTYLVKSKNKRFNPLKYALVFNKLDTLMKKENRDKYFNLEEN